MSKIKTVAAALGLFAGGMAVSQMFPATQVMVFNSSDLDTYPKQAQDDFYQLSLSLNGTKASAVQISQMNDELNTKLQVMQVRQNAEIIRLLRSIDSKTKK